MEAITIDLGKLNNVTKNDNAKKGVFNELIKKNNTVDSNKQNLEKGLKILIQDI